MSHIDYLYTLLTDEVLRREEVLLMKKVENAKLLYEDACIARINWTVNRQLDRKLINTLASNDSTRNSQNIIITGATGCGKTWLADAFGQNACMASFSVKHYTVAGLLRKRRAYEKFGTERNRFELDQMLGKLDLLILDDWSIGTLAESDRFSLYEIIEPWRGRGSSIITSVIPVRL